MAKLALRSNRKFRRLLAMVRVDSPEHLRGHLSALWEATWENGTPLIGDLQDIEALAGWTMADTVKYPPGALADALVKARLVDVVVEGHLYAVHDWYEHAPSYVKQAISRRVAGNRAKGIDGDVTVTAETYYLGLEGWQRRAAEIGIDVLANAEAFGAEGDDPDLPPGAFGVDAPVENETAPVENANGYRNARPLAIRSPKPGDISRFGYLSSLAETRQAEPSPELSSPPRSPAPSFSAGGRDEAAVIRIATRQVTDAIAHLSATKVRADAEAAEELTGHAAACRTPGDWVALSDLATEALRDSHRFLSAYPGGRA